MWCIFENKKQEKRWLLEATNKKLCHKVKKAKQSGNPLTTRQPQQRIRGLVAILGMWCFVSQKVREIWPNQDITTQKLLFIYGQQSKKNQPKPPLFSHLTAARGWKKGLAGLFMHLVHLSSQKGNENVANFKATKLKSYLYTYLDKNKEKIAFFPTPTPLYSADIRRGGERARKSKKEGRNKSLKLGRK